MLQAIDAIQRHTGGRSFEDFVTDEILSAAVFYHFMVLGEAAGSVPREIQELAPLAAWAKVRGMRNQLMHVYFQTDFGIVWETIRGDIPELKAELERLLGENGGPASPTSSLQ